MSNVFSFLLCADAQPEHLNTHSNAHKAHVHITAEELDTCLKITREGITLGISRPYGINCLTPHPLSYHFYIA